MTTYQVLGEALKRSGLGTLKVNTNKMISFVLSLRTHKARLFIIYGDTHMI